MKKALLVLLALTVTVAFAQVNVTFRANTSTVQGITDTSDVTAGGAGLTGVDLRGTVQNVASGGNWSAGMDPMTSVGGDYWELTITFPNDSIGTTQQYKYGFNVLNQDGTVTSSWEGTPNRILTIPAADTVLDVEYVNSETGPFTDVADSLDVYFRVNMATNTDFNPETQQVHMAGSLEGWSHSIVMNREGSSTYYNYHWRGAASTEAPVEVYYKFTLGDWSGTHESISDRYIKVNQDTTIQWVYYNDIMPKPFAASDTLSSLTFSTDVSTAIANHGFDQGDTLLVKWGYGGTQQSVRIDTLVAGFGTVYSVAIPNVGVDLESDGIYYQYYNIKNAFEDREIFFNFDYTGNDVSLAERRLHDLAGAADGAAFTINDNVVSNTDSRRMPKFKNNNILVPTAADTDTSIYYFYVDMRPAVYQVMSGTVLDDIQGDIDINTVDKVLTYNICINGPATGGWTTWGGTLDSDWGKVMRDNGTGADLVPSDTVYSIGLKFQANSTTIGQEFKFGIGGGDNESGYGLNHIENLDLVSHEVYSVWGSINPNFYDAWDYDTNSPNLDIELTEGVPNQFKLGDNYPNPFNPTTTVAFSLPIGVNVTLNVYNLLGEKIATIYNTYAQPGNYTATWNGLDSHGNQVPSGTYLFELDAGEYFHQVKKMTMMK